MSRRDHEQRADTLRELDQDFTGNAVNARSGKVEHALHEQAKQLDDALTDEDRETPPTRH